MNRNSMISTDEYRRTLSAEHNLPVQLTSFVGRERAIDQITDLLGTARLLTLTGAGGVGKTRLALQVAQNLLNRYPDGIWYVDLGSIYEPQLVLHKITATLGCRGETGQAHISILQRFLRERQLLLVVDNCEHMISACAELIADLLSSCPTLYAMTTSRIPLGVPGETLFQVEPLSIPQTEQSTGKVIPQDSEAFQLFVDRAQAFQPNFSVDDQNIQAITQICILLDGIPLAIELAAARVRLLSPHQIMAHLQDNLQVLSVGARTVTKRQQTLEACLDWSYDLLADREKLLLHRLAVFAGNFTLDDAQAVCGVSVHSNESKTTKGQRSRSDYAISLANAEVLGILGDLIDKSLVRVIPDRETSYRLLRPIQNYTWVKLSSSGERDKIRARHLTYYLELARQANPIRRYSEQKKWNQRLELELDNFRAALDWSVLSGETKTGLDLIIELGEFWWRQGYPSEGLTWLNKLLPQYHQHDITQARALFLAGRLARERNEYAQAYSYAQDSLELSREIDYQPGIGEALSLVGTITHFRGQREKAIELLRESVEIFRQLNDDWYVAAKLLYLGDAQIRNGDILDAKKSISESLAIFRRLDDKWGLGFALGNAGEIARHNGDYESALAYEIEALRYQVDLGNKMDIAYELEAIANTTAEQQFYERASKLWGFAEALRESIYSFLPQSYQEDYMPYMTKVKRALGEDGFNQAWQEGRCLCMDDALNLASQQSDIQSEHVLMDVDHPRVEVEHELARKRYGITPREKEVLKLVAHGLTDAEVAEQLVISPRTVSKHLQSIYSKIEVNSRSAATRFALENNLA